MFDKLKIMIGFFAAGAIAVSLGGCSQGRYSSAGPWQWSPTATLQAGNAGSSSAIIVPPGRADAQFFVYANGQTPEFDRRDDSLNIRSNEPYLGSMGWPEQQRPTLDRQRTFHTSRTAERYVYPRVRDDDRRDSRRRGHRYR